MRDIIRWLGVALVVIGVLGFFPFAAPDGMLLGIFHVNALHNLIHLVTGVALWTASSADEDGMRMYLKVFGVVYALVAVLGFVAGDGEILGLITNNMADTWLHVVLAAAFLYWGYAGRSGASA